MICLVQQQTRWRARRPKSARRVHPFSQTRHLLLLPSLFPGPMAFCRATVSWSNAVSGLLPRKPHSMDSRNRCPAPMCIKSLSSNNDSENTSKESQLIVSITGATGFIGRRLVERLIEDKNQVCVLTRSRAKAESIFPGERFHEVVIAEENDWSRCIQGSNVVVNLAGTPISTRWSSETKKEIKDSRIKTTSKVVNLINEINNGARPSVLVSATAVGYYGTSETNVFDEQSPSGNDYLSEVCREWEARANLVDKDVRLVLIRIGIVLGKDGGALAKMIPLFKMFAGGPIGSGKQWFSWIHLDDLVNLIYESILNQSYRGVINGTAPNPVRLSEMCDQLGEIMGRPSWLPVPDFALRAVLGEGATIVLEGQRVIPGKAKELGFSFKYRYVRDALKAVLSS